MSNLSFTNESTINDKIIIEDDSNDSFNSFYSNKSLNNKTKILKVPEKKSFINKICDGDNNEVIIKKNTKSKLNYNKKNYTLVNKTKEILEKSYENYQNSVEKYYQDVLTWMNMVYRDNSKSIRKIKFKQMTLTQEIFDFYNKIIKKYKINKDLFITDNFSFSDEHDRDEIFLISKILTNNLLDKLGYKLIEQKKGDSKQLKIDYKIKYF
jgi:hypothetical protein